MHFLVAVASRQRSRAGVHVMAAACQRADDGAPFVPMHLGAVLCWWCGGGGGGSWVKTESGSEESRKQRRQRDGEGVNKERRVERLSCICYY